MALGDLYTNVQILLRWAHVLAGIIWVGHLYFFNFVNAGMQPSLDGPTKKIVNPQLLGRAFWWFRYGAMATFGLGLLLFTQLYMYKGGGSFGPSALFMDENGLTARAIWILLGMTLAFIMWFNVWFVIWPAQSKILPAVRDGQPVDPALPKRATMASKINTYLSGPMLFCMLAPNHYGSINVVTGVVAFALGFFAIYAAYAHVPKAGKAIHSPGK